MAEVRVVHGRHDWRRAWTARNSRTTAGFGDDSFAAALVARSRSSPQGWRGPADSISEPDQFRHSSEAQEAGSRKAAQTEITRASEGVVKDQEQEDAKELIVM